MFASPRRKRGSAARLDVAATKRNAQRTKRRNRPCLTRTSVASTSGVSTGTINYTGFRPLSSSLAIFHRPGRALTCISRARKGPGPFSTPPNGPQGTAKKRPVPSGERQGRGRDLSGQAAHGGAVFRPEAFFYPSAFTVFRLRCGKVVTRKKRSGRAPSTMIIRSGIARQLAII